MGKIIGVGATKNSGNKEIAVLKAQIKTLNNEVEILKVEKEDLEKLPTELSNKVAELEKQIETVTAEKEAAETKAAELEKQVAKLEKSAQK